jgi:hypothetical protein
MHYQAIDIDNKVFDVYPMDESATPAADAVFAAKEQHYLLPDSAAILGKMACATDTWTEGETEIKLTNIFDFPIKAALQTFFPGDVSLKDAETFKDLPLAPGESITLPLHLKTTSSKGYPAKDVSFWLRVHMQSTDPEQKARFETTYGVRTEAP